VLDRCAAQVPHRREVDDWFGAAVKEVDRNRNRSRGDSDQEER
jgi:hypothetical protein